MLIIWYPRYITQCLHYPIFETYVIWVPDEIYKKKKNKTLVDTMLDNGILVSTLLPTGKASAILSITPNMVNWKW